MSLTTHARRLVALSKNLADDIVKAYYPTDPRPRPDGLTTVPIEVSVAVALDEREGLILALADESDSYAKTIADLSNALDAAHAELRETAHALGMVADDSGERIREACLRRHNVSSRAEVVHGEWRASERDHERVLAALGLPPAADLGYQGQGGIEEALAEIVRLKKLEGVVRMLKKAQE